MGQISPYISEGVLCYTANISVKVTREGDPSPFHGLLIKLSDLLCPQL